MEPTRLSEIQKRIVEKMLQSDNKTISVGEIELLVRDYGENKGKRYYSRRGTQIVQSLAKKPFISLVIKGEDVVGLAIPPELSSSDISVNLICTHQSYQQLLVHNSELENRVIPMLQETIRQLNNELEEKDSKINELELALSRGSKKNSLLNFLSGSSRKNLGG